MSYSLIKESSNKLNQIEIKSDESNKSNTKILFNGKTLKYLPEDGYLTLTHLNSLIDRLHSSSKKVNNITFSDIEDESWDNVPMNIYSYLKLIEYKFNKYIKPYLYKEIDLTHRIRNVYTFLDLSQDELIGSIRFTFRAYSQDPNEEQQLINSGGVIYLNSLSLGNYQDTYLDLGNFVAAFLLNEELGKYQLIIRGKSYYSVIITSIKVILTPKLTPTKDTREFLSVTDDKLLLATEDGVLIQF